MLILNFFLYRGKLDRVVDGDTIDAMIDVGFDIWVKKRIRYKGIDTWESRTRDLAEKKKGLAAKDRNKQLLEEVSSKSGYFRLKSYSSHDGIKLSNCIDKLTISYDDYSEVDRFGRNKAAG